MTAIEQIVLALLRSAPAIVDAIKSWAAGDSDESDVAAEVRAILGPAEDRLERAIRKAEGQ